MSIGKNIIQDKPRRREIPQWQRDKFIKPKVAVKIIEQEDTFTINTPYNYEYIEEFKEAVPEEDRRWDPKKKYWTINKKHISTVKELSGKYFINLDDLPQRLKSYKEKEFKTHTLYKIPKEELANNKELESIIRRMNNNPYTEDYKLDKGILTDWSDKIILLPKEGYYFPQYSVWSRDIDPKGTFFADYQRHRNITAISLKFKKLRMSKAFNEVFTRRREDVINLSDDEILALNKALQFRAKKITFDFEAQDLLSEVVKGMDLKNPKQSKALLQGAYKLAL